MSSTVPDLRPTPGYHRRGTTRGCQASAAGPPRISRDGSLSTRLIISGRTGNGAAKISGDRRVYGQQSFHPGKKRRGEGRETLGYGTGGASGFIWVGDAVHREGTKKPERGSRGRVGRPAGDDRLL